MKTVKADKQDGVVVRECVTAEVVDKGACAAVAKAETYTPADVRFAWTMATNGLRAVVSFGAMLCELDAEISRARFRQDGGKMNGRDEGLKTWLTEHCPEINYKTAMRFRRLAEIALAESGMQIAPGAALKMLACKEEAFFGASPEEARQRAALDSFLAGKSQRDLLQAWAEGGAKPGKVAGKLASGVPAVPQTPEQARAELRAKGVELVMTARNCLRAFTTDRYWEHAKPADIRALLLDIKSDLQDIAKATA